MVNDLLHILIKEVIAFTTFSQNTELADLKLVTSRDVPFMLCRIKGNLEGLFPYAGEKISFLKL